MVERVSFYKDGHSLIASLSCDIDHHSARGLRDEIDKKVIENRPRVLVLDFGGVSFMDSSGIGVLLGRLRILQARGGTLSVKNMQPPVEKLFRLSGLQRVIGIEPKGGRR